MAQPLKGKILKFEQDYIETEIKWNLKLGDDIFKKIEVTRAVRWLKSEIKNNSDIETDLISEPLADIYIKQELFDKAILVFEKLTLKYPEKNIYFANRILEIKSKFNNQ